MSAETETAERHEATGPREHAHPGPREYVKIAVVLAVVTALEIALFYVEDFAEGLEAVIVIALIVLMLIKFALVGLWFMHLKFDNPLFMRLFVAGLGIAVTVFGVVLLLFGAGVLLALGTMGLGLAFLAAAAVRGG